ncbi:fatty acid desaturase [bacterium]|nr:fatty acid desaturase [bacterium]
MSPKPDHKAVIAALPADLRESLAQPSTAAGLRHLAGHLAAIAVTSTLILFTPFWPLALPLQGILLIFLFTLEHETTHRTPFAHAGLNDWVGRACGLVLLLPFAWFRYFHLAHHRHTNLPGLDPELAGAKPQTLRQWLWHVSGIPYWIAEAGLLLGLARGNVQAAYLPARALPGMQREAQVMLALYALALGSLFVTPVLLWLWIVPVVLGQPFLRLYLLAEHGDCPMVANMLENTRTTFTNRIVRFLAWNMPYHVEHHAYPAVPFHRLPALHDRMRGHLQVTAQGYARFSRDYLARRRG